MYTYKYMKISVGKENNEQFIASFKVHASLVIASLG
jgi:hypothetical protein